MNVIEVYFQKKNLRSELEFIVQRLQEIYKIVLNFSNETSKKLAAAGFLVSSPHEVFPGVFGLDKILHSVDTEGFEIDDIRSIQQVDNGMVKFTVYQYQFQVPLTLFEKDITDEDIFNWIYEMTKNWISINDNSFDNSLPSERT